MQFCNILRFQCFQRSTANIRTVGYAKLIFTYQLVLSNQDSHCKHLQPVAFLGTFEIHRSFAPLPSLWQILCRKRKFNFIRKTTKTDNKHLPKTKVKQTRPNRTYPLRTPRTRLRTKNDPQIMSVTKYNHGQELPTASLI